MLINDHEIIIERKDVKHINLKVYPDLTIKASVPKGMQLTTVKRMMYEYCPKWESYHDSLNKLLNSNKID